MRPQTREFLNKAKSLIQEYGWIQGHFESRDQNGKVCGYCVVGALYRASEELDTMMEFGPALQYVIAKLGVYDRTGVASYNDHPNRTKEQVLAVFD